MCLRSVRARAPALPYKQTSSLIFVLRFFFFLLNVLLCLCQIHGVCHETIDFAYSLLQTECNSATDNPMIFAHLHRDTIPSSPSFSATPVPAFDQPSSAAAAAVGTVVLPASASHLHAHAHDHGHSHMHTHVTAGHTLTHSHPHSHAHASDHSHLVAPAPHSEQPHTTPHPVRTLYTATHTHHFTTSECAVPHVTPAVSHNTSPPSASASAPAPAPAPAPSASAAAATASPLKRKALSSHATTSTSASASNFSLLAPLTGAAPASASASASASDAAAAQHIDKKLKASSSSSSAAAPATAAPTTTTTTTTTTTSSHTPIPLHSSSPSTSATHKADGAHGALGLGVILSGGNFHGEYPAKASDILAIGVHELSSVSERRIERLVNPQLSSLPAFLVCMHDTYLTSL